jgi:hypothetical protein
MCGGGGCVYACMCVCVCVYVCGCVCVWVCGCVGVGVGVSGCVRVCGWVGWVGVSVCTSINPTIYLAISHTPTPTHPPTPTSLG